MGMRMTKQPTSMGLDWYAIWKSPRVHICWQCHRAIQKPDQYRFVFAYRATDPEKKDYQPVEIICHRNCKDFRHRPRLSLPEPEEAVLHSGDKEIRRLSMTATDEQAAQTADEVPAKAKRTKRTKKSTTGRKKKATTGKKKAPAKGKKTTGKKKGKKPADRKPRADSMMKGLGATLKKLLKGNKKVGKIITLLTKNETPTNAQLIALRDEIKAQAAKARKEDDGSRSSELSAANRLVRRLERSTR